MTGIEKQQNETREMSDLNVLYHCLIAINDEPFNVSI